MKKATALAIVVIAMTVAITLAACSGGGKRAGGEGSTPITTKAVEAVGIGEDGDAVTTAAVPSSATVLIYLNGSDLESQDGEATDDITEMLESGIGASGKTNVVIETLGTSKWQRYGIASDHTQRYIVKDGDLVLVDDGLGQLDTTDPKTLSDFISWGAASYPAERYMLLLWDHGAGPVYGFGYDEFQSDYAVLTLDEIQDALEANPNVHFDFIGMDCCLMSSLETCCVLAPFCDYAILSEDFEPSLGWSYEGWMEALEKDPGIGTIELGERIVDDAITAVTESPWGENATLALIDESLAPLLYSTWVDFAYENENALLGTNYSQETTSNGRAPGGPGGPGHGPGGGWGGPDDYGWNGGWGGWEDWSSWSSVGSATMTDYYVTDIMATASSIDSDTSAALAAAVSNTVVHYGCTSGETGMTGISVTLPYGDAEFYDELSRVFTACGFDEGYIDWLEVFVDASGVDNPYDYEEFDKEWSGWDDFDNDFDWQDWAENNEDYWREYEDFGWYDDWYDDFDLGWEDFFYDDWGYGPGGW